jgi:hypothetical protein
MRIPSQDLAAGLVRQDQSKASLEFALIRIATNLGKVVRYRASAIMALSP